jgi:hypothetical protein
MRQGVAGILYARNRVAGELAKMRAEPLDEEHAAHVARAERALAELEREAHEAIAALVATRDDLRANDRDRLLARVTELSIQREVDRLA